LPIHAEARCDIGVEKICPGGRKSAVVVRCINGHLITLLFDLSNCTRMFGESMPALRRMTSNTSLLVLCIL